MKHRIVAAVLAVAAAAGAVAQAPTDAELREATFELTGMLLAVIALEVIKSDLDAEEWAAGVRVLMEQTLQASPERWRAAVFEWLRRRAVNAGEDPPQRAPVAP